MNMKAHKIWDARNQKRINITMVTLVDFNYYDDRGQLSQTWFIGNLAHTALLHEVIALQVEWCPKVLLKSHAERRVRSLRTSQRLPDAGARRK
jgi:hypothetical protein